MKKLLAYILLYLLTIDVSAPMYMGIIEHTHAATTSVVYVGTAVDSADQGNPWTNPTNAQGNTTSTVATGDYAGNNKTSNTFILRNFDLAAQGINAAATIHGVQVEIEWDGSTNIVDTKVQLTKDGSTPVGSNYASSTTQTTKAIQSYGGLSDLWGTTLVGSDVLSSNFGFVFQTLSTSGGQHSVNVYRARITVDYTNGATNNDPTDIALSPSAIDENVAGGSTVGTLTTTDADTGDTHTYSFVAGTGDADNASFTLSGSSLNIDASPDYETKSLYSVRIQTDDGNGGTYSEALTITINDLDEIDPTIDSTNFASGSLLPGGNHDIIIGYSDTGGSGIDPGSKVLTLHKWDGVSAWGPDISATGIVSIPGGNYATNNLVFGKYQYRFSIRDWAGNTGTHNLDFYIDTPELIITGGSGSIDIGILSDVSDSFSDQVIVTVKTVGAAYSLTLNTNGPFSQGVDTIDDWDGTDGYGYDPWPYSSNISTINTDENIGTVAANLNTNGDQNTVIHVIKIGALIDIQQSAGDYEGHLDFGISLTY